jgi:hypothetical protein
MGDNEFIENFGGEISWKAASLNTEKEVDNIKLDLREILGDDGKRMEVT